MYYIQETYLNRFRKGKTKDMNKGISGKWTQF